MKRRGSFDSLASAIKQQNLSGVSGLRACLKNRRMPFDSAGRYQIHRAVAERLKASVCKTEGNSPRRFESALHVQIQKFINGDRSVVALHRWL